VIDTPYQTLEVITLGVECATQNNGPQNALFDLGVIFGADPADIGSPPYPSNAQGVYHGAAFGWLEPGAYSPSWSIDFRSGSIEVGTGAPLWPTKSVSELKPHGNSFSGSGTIHLRAVVWSRASGSTFALRVESCILDVVVEGSEMLATTATVTITLTETQVSVRTETTKLFGSFSETEALLLVAILSLTPVAYVLGKRTRRATGDETKIY
jgi:hypothetical protein